MAYIDLDVDDGGTWHDLNARAEWVRLTEEINRITAEHAAAGRGATPAADMAARRTESAGLFDRVRALSNQALHVKARGWKKD